MIIQNIFFWVLAAAMVIAALGVVRSQNVVHAALSLVVVMAGAAAQFILLGGDTAQVCTGVMKFGYDCVKRMCDELLAFMEKHKFETIADFKGHSLQYFTTHADLVKRQAEAKAAAKAKAKGMVTKDNEWQGDNFVKQSDALARG